MAYGKELILDLYGCDVTKFTRESITEWLEQLCDLIDMEREDLHFWDYEDCPEEREKAPPHLLGTSAVQFIKTSDIVIHSLEMVRECYINLFSCKEYDSVLASSFTAKWFGSEKYEQNVIERGRFTKCKINSN